MFRYGTWGGGAGCRRLQGRIDVARARRSSAWPWRRRRNLSGDAATSEPSPRRSGLHHGIAVGAHRGCVLLGIPRSLRVLGVLPAGRLHSEGVLAAEGSRSRRGGRPRGSRRRVHPADGPVGTTRCARGHCLVELVHDEDFAHASTIGGPSRPDPPAASRSAARSRAPVRVRSLRAPFGPRWPAAIRPRTRCVALDPPGDHPAVQQLSPFTIPCTVTGRVRPLTVRSR